MPKFNQKRSSLELTLLKGCFDIFCSNKIIECNKVFEETILEYFTIINYRYYNSKRLSVPKSRDWIINILPQYDDSRFKSCLRVSRSQFSFILQRIDTTTIFTSLKRSNKCPTETQLAVALYRFGNDGSGASYQRVAEHFGVSEAGMIQQCTERVIQALLSLEREFISWPNAFERTTIVKNMENELPGCVGYLDGSHIPLFEAPKDNHEAYYSRKQMYGIHLQAICDNDLTFRSISVGYPASAHDARVFANSPLGQHPERFLSESEWIAADSAYKLTKNVVTPFRENATTGTTLSRRKFNRYFSGFRVKIEHAFGILKKVFGSLKSLRVRVDKRTGHRKACEWIVSCIILYNMIRPQDNYGEEDGDTEDNDIDNEQQNDTNITDSSQRDFLFNWFKNTKCH